MSDNTELTDGSLTATLFGIRRLRQFSWKRFFSEVPKRHTPDDVDLLLTVGSSCTTPRFIDIATDWPKPWAYSRILLLLAFGFFFFLWTYRLDPANANIIPGLIMLGAFTVPVSVLLLFFELNLARNVSIFKTLATLLAAGAVSILFALAGFTSSIGALLGALFDASSAAFIEEPAKLAAGILAYLFFFRRDDRDHHYRFVGNGLLIGAAVGAGFAAFESAGYIYRIGIFEPVASNLAKSVIQLVASPDIGDLDQLGKATDAYMQHMPLLYEQDFYNTVLTRGVLAPFQHTLWTAIVVGALFRERGAERLALRHFTSRRFLKFLLFAMAGHFINNADADLSLLLALGIAVLGWFIVMHFVQEEMDRVRREQTLIRAAAAALREQAVTGS